MIATALLPSRFRGEQPAAKPVAPSWLSKKVTPVLQYLAGLTCSNPMHTLVVVALLASTTYIGLLEESLFDATKTVQRKAEWSSLAEGSRRLRAGEDTAWRWQSEVPKASVAPDADHLALLTLVFPESSSVDDPRTAPPAATVPVPHNLSLTPLPSTSNSFSTYAQESALAFSLPYDQAAEFLVAAQEIPSDEPGQETRESEQHGREAKKWIMKAARVQQPRSSLARWGQNAWAEFLDLLKNAESLDIVIMVLGYISMHLTFVSLFLSMRRLGSNFWLATSVLLSSVFAFLFGLIVTTKLGVPITMVLLSEGLPFLVVTIGFEKNIVLTRAVLTHAVERHRSSQQPGAKPARSVEASQSLIQSAIQAAVKEQGFDIVKDYAVEIALLIAGACSGVQGGLQQFCFLAAWILVFDCILLFSFYVAILCVKLEINRIKRHVETRRTLVDDGVSRRVAEVVAKGNDWPGSTRSKGDDTDSNPPETSIFGRHLRSVTIPKFKVLMVSGFVVINVLNLCTLPFRGAGSLASLSSWASGLGGLVSPPAVDPFKVASNGLDSILAAAKAAGVETVVTVLTPIRYELEFPSVHYDLPQAVGSVPQGGFDGYVVGGKMVGGILKSLEDPVLSKWIVVALAMSVALNGYLFNVARWGIRDPNLPDHPIDPADLAQAQKFNDTDAASPTLGDYASSRARQQATRPVSETASETTTVVAEPEVAKTEDEDDVSVAVATPSVPKTTEEIEAILKEKRARDLSDEEIVALSLQGKIPGYALEKTLGDFTRAVKIRRTIISRTKATSDLTGVLDKSKLPFRNYNWAQVFGACCENVIGYTPVPVGVAGPLVIDGQSYFIPMATTEGVLVASASRGCKAINAGGGAVTILTSDGMTRGPCVSFETLERAGDAKHWLDSEAGQATMKRAFNSTSRFARLETIKTAVAGTNLYVRFKTTTGDAMGMNMISKGVEHALSVMMGEGFEDMNIVSVSGNYCTDKKAAAINWIDGRGKSVVAEAIIPGDVVQAVLKTDVDTMVELNVNKNLIGSAMAGSIGGFNAHAANLVAALFIATGQDPAQVVEGSSCITIMKNLRGSLQISVSMPSIEVGTLGGGTILEPQSAMLDMLGVRGPHPTNPGENARRLARIVAATVLAGELSLCGALAAGHLVRAHMQHNRSTPATRANTPAPPAGLAMSSRR